MVASSAQEVLRDGPLKNGSSFSFSSSFFVELIPNTMASVLPSTRALFKSLLAYSQLLFLSTSNPAEGGSPPVCTNPQTSCQNTSAVANTCCFNAPGGQLLQVSNLEHPLPLVHLLTISTVDPILGHKPFDWPLEFLDHSRPMARPLRRHLRRQLRPQQSLYQHLLHPHCRRRNLGTQLHEYVLEGRQWRR